VFDEVSFINARELARQILPLLLALFHSGSTAHCPLIVSKISAF
jgi:hypothetical protein